MKGLASTQVADLNRQTNSGLFFEAIIVTRVMTEPKVIDYFANFSRRISFGGSTYEMCPLYFDGMNTTSQMEIPANTVKLFNVGGMINRYVYDHNIRIKRNDITLQILHCDQFGRFTMYDQEELQILVVRGSPGVGGASIFASLGWKLGDRVPKETMETSEYPGIRADVVRTGNG